MGELGRSKSPASHVSAEATATRRATLWNENHLTFPVARSLWSYFNNFTLYLYKELQININFVSFLGQSTDLIWQKEIAIYLSKDDVWYNNNIWPSVLIKFIIYGPATPKFEHKKNSLKMHLGMRLLINQTITIIGQT